MEIIIIVTFQTDDKNMNAEQGHFEGFFVGSEEFCKFNKFDKDNDRKDIRGEYFNLGKDI